MNVTKRRYWGRDLSDTQRGSPWTKRAKRWRIEFVMRVRVYACGCSGDGSVKEMAMTMLNMEAVCSRSGLPNMFLANEGCCKINAVLVCDVG